MPSKRLRQYIEAAENLKNGNYDFDLFVTPIDDDMVGKLGLALRDLAQTLEKRYQELQKLDQITRHINAGLLLDEILENIYRDFRELIPYNRIGCALLEDEGRVLRARWAKSDQPAIKLPVGYEARMQGSSLEQILHTGRPRIINDLTDYLHRKPEFKFSHLVSAEGIRSSFTCPLIANGVPVGFIFFSGIEPNTYKQAHIHSYLRIAEQLSVIVEKGRLVSELASQKAAIESKNSELVRLNDVKNQFLASRPMTCAIRWPIFRWRPSLCCRSRSLGQKTGRRCWMISAIRRSICWCCSMSCWMSPRSKRGGWT